ncbi:MAG: SulP family inorganic anion transporter [Sedimenticolaceae bacterium]
MRAGRCLPTRSGRCVAPRGSDGLRLVGGDRVSRDAPDAIDREDDSRPDEDYRPDREMFSQGLQHIFMGFFSGAPGSNSFNESALNRELGGGRVALLVSAAVTVLMVQLAGDVVASIPMRALGGAMVLVGLGMLSLKKYRQHLRSGLSGHLLFALPAALAVIMDIQSALFIGFGLSLMVHRCSRSCSSRDSERYAESAQTARSLFSSSSTSSNTWLSCTLASVTA